MNKTNKSRILRVAALIVALVAVFALTSLSVFAAGSGTQTMALSVSQTTAYPGDTVEITVNISDNPGISSLQFDLRYDEYLTLEGVEFNSAFGAYVTTPTPYKNPQRVTFISPLSDVTAEGEFATLTFSVSNDAPDNYFAGVSCYISEAFNSNFDSVSVSVANGGINVSHGIWGDVNRDRVVDTRDPVLLFRYIAGWDVEIDENAIDVNYDGAVDTKDAILLFRYVAGWDIEIPDAHKHTIVHTNAKAESCLENGNIEYWYCSSCDKYFSDDDCNNEITLADTVIGATGHTPVIDKGYAATCTACGLTDGSHCGACGEIIVAQTTIPATGHNYVNNVCTNCGEVKASEGLEFKLNSDGKSYSVKGIGTCTDTDVIIPSSYNGLPVTKIGGYAFASCKTLRSVTISDSVIEIDYDAFFYCTSLQSLSLGSKVAKVSVSAFHNCPSISSITVSEENDSFKDIDGNLYTKDGKTIVKYSIGKSATSFNIPDSVVYIGAEAFYDCTTLTSVIISYGVVEIGNRAFSGCKNLENVTISNSVKTIDEYAFSACNSIKSIDIPDSVTSIGNFAFKGCDILESVNIGSGVNIIGRDPFSLSPSITSITVSEENASFKDINGNLYTKDGKTIVKYAIGKPERSFTIPDGVICIGEESFHYCINLTSITIPYGVTSIGEYAFSLCENLSGFAIPDSVITIDGWAISYCDSITSVTIPDSVITIGEAAFFNCDGLTSVFIPDSVISIGERAFSLCDSLTDISVSSGNPNYKDIDGNLYSKEGNIFIQYAIGRRATSFTIPYGVISIGRYAFEYCRYLKSITISDSVIFIDEGAFYNCSITSVTVFNSVTYIGSDAFGGCYYLTDVYYNGTEAEWNEIIIGERNEYLFNATIHFLGEPQYSEGLEFALNSDGESYSVTGIGACTDTDLIIPPAYNGLPVTGIGYEAFKNCTNLTSITFPDGISRIQEGAFTNCSGLIKTQNGIQYVNNWVVGSTAGVISAIIKDGTVGIADKAFYSSSNVVSVTLPNGLRYVGSDAFKECRRLVEVINLSSLDIVLGSTQCGYVAFNAIEVHTGSSNIVEVDGFIFYNDSYIDINEEEEIDEYIEKNFEMLIEKYFGNNNGGPQSLQDLTPYIYPYVVENFEELVRIYCGMTSEDYVYYYLDAHMHELVRIYVEDTYGDSIEELFDAYLSDYDSCVEIIEHFYGESIDVVLADLIDENYDEIADYYINKYYDRFLNIIAYEFDQKYGVGAFEALSPIEQDMIMHEFIAEIKASYELRDEILADEELRREIFEKLQERLLSDEILKYEIYDIIYEEITHKLRGDEEFRVYASEIAREEILNNMLSNREFLAAIAKVLIREKIAEELYAGKNYLVAYVGTSPSVILPENFNGEPYVIFKNAFYGCSFIKRIDIPVTILFIGESAFAGCSGLIDVYYNGTEAQWDEIQIGDGNEYLLNANIHFISKLPYSEGLTFTLNSDGKSYSVSGRGTCIDTSIVIPSTYNGLPVTAIMSGSFLGDKKIYSVTIPESITDIGEAAFHDCWSLVEIINHSSLDIVLGSRDHGDIASNALEVHTGDSKITYYNDFVFYNLNSVNYLVKYDGNDSTVVLPSSYKGGEYAIYKFAFLLNTTITDVTVGAGVFEISPMSFLGCMALVNISVEAGNTVYSSIDGNLYSYDGKTIVLYAAGKPEDSFTIPSNVTEIGVCAFNLARNLSEIVIPDGIVKIGEWAFLECMMETIYIPHSVTSIDPEAFNEAYIDYIVYDGSEEEWNTIFCGELYSDTIVCFFGNKHEHVIVTIPIQSPTCTDYGMTERSYCSECGKIFQEGEEIEPLGHYFIFYDAKAPTCTEVGWDEYIACGWFCEFTTYVEIPALGHNYVNNVCTNCGDGKASEGLEFALNSDGESYAVSGRGTCTDADLIIPPTYNGLPVTKIGDEVFFLRTSLKSVIIPDSVTEIGTGAFYGCTSLTSVIIPYGVIEIGECAFYGCESLENITIPNSVTEIGIGAFLGCASLVDVTIPASVATIGDLAFADCTNLVNITVSSDNVNYKAVDGNLYSKDGTVLLQYAIGKSDASFIIPDGVTKIGMGAFAGCAYLTGVTIPYTVTTIGDYAFVECTNLSTVYYDGIEAEWEQISIGSDNELLLEASIYYIGCTDVVLPWEPELDTELLDSMLGAYKFDGFYFWIEMYWDGSYVISVNNDDWTIYDEYNFELIENEDGTVTIKLTPKDADTLSLADKAIVAVPNEYVNWLITIDGTQNDCDPVMDSLLDSYAQFPVEGAGAEITTIYIGEDEFKAIFVYDEAYSVIRYYICTITVNDDNTISVVVTKVLKTDDETGEYVEADDVYGLEDKEFIAIFSDGCWSASDVA